MLFKGEWVDSFMLSHYKPWFQKERTSFVKGHPMADNTVLEHIQKTISENDVVLYMKGTPVFPQWVFRCCC